VKFMSYRGLFLIALVMVVLLTACASIQEEGQQPTTEIMEVDPPQLTAAPTDPPQLVETITLSPSEVPPATPVTELPPGPIEIQFTASDGQELSGLYFPASENPAPIIVLMTWSRGNQSEWEEVATWLQGRGLLVRAMNSRETWKSSNWYPERTLSMPLGVFTFNFRSCEEEDGCLAYLPVEWLLDAQAALEAAAKLEGADPERILAVGASNGGDGAVDSCAWMNTTDLGRCKGAFALSPSSSLTIDFRDAAGSLLSQEDPVPVYCLYGLVDDASAETCADFPEIQAISYGYTEHHGLELILVDRRPDPLNVLQQFIEEALGGDQ
jgi:dienelactone hydrolase